MALAIINDENSTGGKPFGGAASTETVSASMSTTESVLPSSTILTTVVITVSILVPFILISNLLLLAAVRRCTRHRNPSNGFVISLASADAAVGIYLPFGAYFELSSSTADCPSLCVLPYCAIIAVCGVSVLSTTAIALDRYISLAKPLRYNNIITHQSVIRYVVVFWIYALLLASVPFIHVQLTLTELPRPTCTFAIVHQRVRVFLFCTLYCPCAIVTSLCYAYVYLIARSHAQAISSVELSLRQHCHNSQAFHPRYGRTLALTVGLFLGLWLPFQVCMLSDAIGGTHFLHTWIHVVLALMGLANSGVNPWIYGYRSSELRLAFHRILIDVLACLRLGPKPTLTSLQVDGLDLQSYASNARLLCATPSPIPRPSVSPIGDNDTIIIVCESVLDSEINTPEIKNQFLKVSNDD
uniref:G-protein coupled receptors family 1 profile domain-containing protein n=1 Tax=Strigamia maritima TaxID=126957 RepID=T1J3K8_STRMM